MIKYIDVVSPNVIEVDFMWAVHGKHYVFEMDVADIPFHDEWTHLVIRNKIDWSVIIYFTNISSYCKKEKKERAAVFLEPGKMCFIHLGYTEFTVGIKEMF